MKYPRDGIERLIERVVASVTGEASNPIRPDTAVQRCHFRPAHLRSKDKTNAR